MFKMFIFLYDEENSLINGEGGKKQRKIIVFVECGLPCSIGAYAVLRGFGLQGWVGGLLKNRFSRTLNRFFTT